MKWLLFIIVVLVIALLPGCSHRLKKSDFVKTHYPECFYDEEEDYISCPSPFDE